MPERREAALAIVEGLDSDLHVVVAEIDDIEAVALAPEAIRCCRPCVDDQDARSCRRRMLERYRAPRAVLVTAEDEVDAGVRERSEELVRAASDPLDVLAQN